MDSVSKSGTSRFSGELSERYQAPAMRAKIVTCKTATTPATSCNNQTKSYLDVNAGGPAVKDKLFYYGSYYQPHSSRVNVSNAYGTLPNYSSNRYEGFGKLTLTPKSGVLINGSYRGSKRVDKSNLFGTFASVSTGTGGETSQKILTLDGSWIVKNNSVFSFKLTHFGNPNESSPDNISNAIVSTTVGTQLDIANLDTQGLVNVPLANSTAANAAAINTFRQIYINRYGYDANGVKNGGGSSATARRSTRTTSSVTRVSSATTRCSRWARRATTCTSATSATPTRKISRATPTAGARSRSSADRTP